METTPFSCASDLEGSKEFYQVVGMPAKSGGWLAGDVTQATCHLDQATCHLAHATCHLAEDTCHLAQATCHLAQATYRLAQASCHLGRLLTLHVFILLPPDHAYCRQHPSAVRRIWREAKNFIKLWVCQPSQAGGWQAM
jgi:hypothetical protein